MKKKKSKNKINKKVIILGIIAITLILGIIIFICIKNTNKGETPIIKKNKDFFEVKKIESQKMKVADNYVFTTYEDFKDFFESDEIKKESFENNNYVLLEISYDSCRESNITPTKYVIDGNKIDVTIKYTARCGGCAPYYLYYLLKVDKSLTDVEVNKNYKAVNNPDCPRDVAYKPIIYLYPQEEKNVEVKLENSDLLTTTYPKYKESWKVLASPNGTLHDLETNRELYGLYWEGKNHTTSVQKDGFIVKGEDTINFLEEKLSILGLTEREADEFIIYWLPKLEVNKYNYIRFETEEEINNYMPLNITPKPDTVIRVLMDYKPLNSKIKVKEQVLNKKERIGFTVVEWGGSKIN